MINIELYSIAKTLCDVNLYTHCIKQQLLILMPILYSISKVTRLNNCMYICICNQITDSMLKEDARYITKCGTNCGKCIPYIQQNLIPGTEDAIYSEEELLLAYRNAQLGGMG